jgi:hypothetical protein
MRIRTTPRLTSLLAVVAAAVAVVGCSGMTKGKEDADRAVAEFHAQLNAGRYDAIWDAGGDDLKGAISRKDFSALLAAVRRKLGDVTGSTTRSWNVNSRNLTTYVALVQDTTFVTGKATETFQYVVRDGRAVLIGYNISSLDLILR